MDYLNYRRSNAWGETQVASLFLNTVAPDVGLDSRWKKEVAF